MSRSPCPAGAKPPTIERAVMLGTESSPITVAHACSFTSAIGRAAAAAATARPIAEVKEQAWATVMGDDSVPNITARSIVGGFAPAGQGDLLMPYVERYFAQIPDVCDRRSSAVAQRVVIGLSPHWAISGEAVAIADKSLAGDHPSARRRLVTEGKAGIELPLRARAFDTQS